MAQKTKPLLDGMTEAVSCNAESIVRFAEVGLSLTPVTAPGVGGIELKLPGMTFNSQVAIRPYIDAVIIVFPNEST